MANWNQLIGKRILIRKTYSNNTIEVTVIEVSPSGERVKFRYVNGYESWTLADEYIVSEILALSLFQWKDVADGLPEATGLFVASIKGRGLMITGFAVDSDSDKWRWEEKYDRYIPYPIPIYEEGAQ